MQCTNSSTVFNPDNQPINYLSKSVITTSQHNSLTDCPTTLQNILSPDVGIQKVIAKVDANELTTFTDSLLAILRDLKSDANELTFLYQGQIYALANSDNHALEVKNEVGEVLTKLEQFSLKKLRSRLTLLNLFRQLDPRTQTTFQPLFDLKHIGRINVKSPIVSGDLDGSTARQIVLGIQAGMIHINEEGIALLVRIMNAEADVLFAINTIRKGQPDEDTAQQIVQIILRGGEVMPEEVEELFNLKQTALEKLSVIKNVEAQVLFAGFQANEDIQNTMEDLVPHLTFENGHTPFISIGDGAHDRFSNNKDVDRYIREMLQYYGAVFILGNHDVFLKKVCDDSKMNPNFMWVFGCFAKDSATGEDWEIHQNRAFVNAYYDELTNTLYLHHGLGELITKDDARLGRVLILF